jgi:hypothetical protein
MTWYYEILVVGGWMLLLWFLQNIIHEESHALVGKIFGRKVAERYWWFNRKEEDGKRFFARIVWEKPLPETSNRNKALIKAAPVITNTTVIITISTVLMTVSMWDHITYVLAAFMFVNLIDGANNCRLALTVKDAEFERSNGDLVKVARRMEWGLGTIRAISGSWVALFTVVATLALIFLAD